MAQNSCNKEAILEYDDFIWVLTVLWRGTISGSVDVKWSSSGLWSRFVKVRKNSFLCLQTIETGDEFAVTTLRNKVPSAGYLDQEHGLLTN